ncbi:hypothetical protein [Aurantiacibacter xanthus]|uniref:hypothetical protein n=1 Tax=Aurantiacibacter xanthus TaxID=1784712 RepID=UPI0011C21910|nr:hypothetical protein [Aurantiacibacter xanthus]
MNKMKLLFRIFSGCPTGVNAIAIISFLFIIIKSLIFDNYREVFFGAQKIGFLIEACLISILASYIFYIIVVRIPFFTERASIHPSVSRHAHLFLSRSKSFSEGIDKVYSTNLWGEKNNPGNVGTILSKIRLDESNAPAASMSSGQNLNWYQYILSGFKESDKSAEIIFRYGALIDTEMANKITIIQSSTFRSMFTQFSQIRNNPLAPKEVTMINFAKPLSEYLNLIEDFEIYLSKYNARYQ